MSKFQVPHFFKTWPIAEKINSPYSAMIANVLIKLMQTIGVALKFPARYGCVQKFQNVFFLIKSPKRVL